MSSKSYIKLVKGKIRWYYLIRSANGRTLTISQKYYGPYKSNAKRAAERLAMEFNIEVRE